MILINHVMIEKPVYSAKFLCDIDRCKGMCCIEGDFGAPLEEEEIDIISTIQAEVRPYLEPSSRAYLDENEPTQYYEENKQIGTPVHEDGRCVYAVYNMDGSIGCGIEHAWRDKKIDFQKPVSCHLYPIRIKKNHDSGMELMTYEHWDICSPACAKGDKEDVLLHKFTKDAIIRKYGSDFYEQLLAAVEVAE